MCGRFTHLYTWPELHRLMRLTTGVKPPGGAGGRDGAQGVLRASYNVAPTQTALIVRQDGSGERTAVEAKWGLVPFWAEDPGIGNRLINARAEEAAVKPAFREAVKRRRCLVPTSGFYEWQAVEGSKRKQPWYFTVKDAPVFGIAGLWERWEKGDGSGPPLETFTILTGKPNRLVAPVHHRMPVIVRPELYDLWLDPGRESMDGMGAVLEPFAAEAMEAHRVGTRVNSPANNDPSLVECED
jgi:putative SOS response-associated peptidase YedK